MPQHPRGNAFQNPRHHPGPLRRHRKIDVNLSRPHPAPFAPHPAVQFPPITRSQSAVALNLRENPARIPTAPPTASSSRPIHRRAAVPAHKQRPTDAHCRRGKKCWHKLQTAPRCVLPISAVFWCASNRRPARQNTAEIGRAQRDTRQTAPPLSHRASPPTRRIPQRCGSTADEKLAGGLPELPGERDSSSPPPRLRFHQAFFIHGRPPSSPPRAAARPQNARSVSSTALMRGTSCVRNKSVFPRLASTAKNGSAHRTSSPKNSNACGSA